MDDNAIFSPAYPLQFLSRDPFRFDVLGLNDALGRRLGSVDSPAAADEEKAHLFFLRDFPVELQDATVCAQLAFLHTDDPADPASFEDALKQSWDTDDTAARLETCNYSLGMINLMSSTLPQKDRRRIIAGGLLAALDIMQPDLIHWPQTQQLVDAEKAAAILAEPEQSANPVYGFSNVRLFNLEGTGGEMVMDTLGLGALGLTDLQMSFRGLEPAAVAGLLQSLAGYLLENGDVIDNGHTVQGLTPDDRWLCMHEMALVEPQRVVLDIDPGAPFAVRPD